MLKWFRNHLVTGILVTLPLVVTIYVLMFVFNLVDGILSRFLEIILKHSIPGVGFVAMLILFLAIGVVYTNVFGKKVIAWAERKVTRIPLVKNIYTVVKQVVDAFTNHGKRAFERVVLVEYPRAGIYSVGFIAADAPPEILDHTGRECQGVFIPTTPNPTSGFIMYFPRKDVIFLNMSVEDGFKLIISCGTVAPNQCPGGLQSQEQAAGSHVKTAESGLSGSNSGNPLNPV